jgi:proteasome lid subunit RPN8/RPN11
VLRLNKSTVTALIREAAAQPDREVCGLLWASEGLRAQTVRPLPNVHPDPAKYYRTAPRDVREAYQAMDEDQGTPLAWYHSHPGGKPDPSEEDMLGAMAVGMHYLIVYPETDQVPSDPGMLRKGYITQWIISAWECISTGVLVQADWDVAV